MSIKSLFRFSLVGATLVVLGSCANETTTVSAPSLSADDKMDVLPCPNQDLLTSSEFLNDIKTASSFLMIVNLSVFPAEDCSRNGDLTTSGTDLTMKPSTGNWDSLLGVGVGNCGDSFNVKSFPKAGVYRRDFKFTSNGRSYRVRMRATVSAGDYDVTGKALLSELGADKISSTLDFVDEKGNTLPQDATIQNVFTTLMPSQTIKVKKKSSGATLLNVKVEMICASRI
ncbi:MAG: hypothetical protein AB7F43_09775 [Bacteriovoracia bacterium]